MTIPHNKHVQELMDRALLQAAVQHAWECFGNPFLQREKIHGDICVLPLIKLEPPLQACVSYDAMPTIHHMKQAIATYQVGYNSKYSHRLVWRIIVTTPNIDPQFCWIAAKG